MNELQIFENHEFGSIRSLIVDGEPWFVGKDVCDVLKYVNHRKAIIDHVDEEDKGVTKCDTLGGVQDLTIINESGLYSLIFGSKLPAAKRFKRWVTSEVLPAIRRTGKYDAINRRRFTTSDYFKAAELVANCNSERLPYVLGFLKNAGVPLPEVKQSAHVKEDDEIAWSKVVKVMKQYSVRELEKMLDVPASCICYYRAGRYKPFPDRRKKITKILMNK